MPLLTLPNSLAVGDIITYANEKAQTREGRMNRCTFAGSHYFKRMKDLGLYINDLNEIKRKITKLNLDGIFEQKLI